MSRLPLYCTMFSVFLLAGCSAKPSVVAASTESSYPNRYQLFHAASTNEDLMLDQQTGVVWKYAGTKDQPFTQIGAVQPVEQWVRGADGKLHKQ